MNIKESLELAPTNGAVRLTNAHLMDVQTLADAYVAICEEYRRRLCENWELHIGDSWWIPEDRPGQALALNDCEFSLSIDDVRLMVDCGVTFDEFLQWWDYQLTGLPINAFTWFVLKHRPTI